MVFCLCGKSATRSTRVVDAKMFTDKMVVQSFFRIDIRCQLHEGLDCSNHLP